MKKIDKIVRRMEDNRALATVADKVDELVDAVNEIQTFWKNYVEQCEHKMWTPNPKPDDLEERFVCHMNLNNLWDAKTLASEAKKWMREIVGKTPVFMEYDRCSVISTDELLKRIGK